MKKTDEKKPLVVVVSRKLQNELVTIRSLAEFFRVEVIRNVSKEEAGYRVENSRYVDKFTEVVTKKQPDANDFTLENVVLEYWQNCDEPVVFYPTDGYTLKALNNIKSEHSDFLCPYFDDYDSILSYFELYAKNKDAEAVGLKTLSMKKFDPNNGDFKFPDEMDFPVRFNCNSDINRRPLDRRVCEDEEEIKTYIASRKSPNRDLELIITEEIDTEDSIRIPGYSFNGEVVAPIFIVKKEDEEDKVECARSVHEISEIEGLSDKVEALMAKYSYNGSFEIRFMRDRHNLIFRSVDFQIESPGMCKMIADFNIPVIVCKHLLGLPVTEEDARHTAGKIFIDEYDVIKSYAKFKLSKKEVNEVFKNVDVRLISDSDDAEGTEAIVSWLGEYARNKRKNKKKSNLKNTFRPFLAPVKNILKGYPQAKPGNKRKADSELPRVLLAGRNYCSNLCMAKSFGKAGYEVEILRIFHRKPKEDNLLTTLAPEAHSKYTKAYYVCTMRGSSRRIVDMLIKLADPDRKMLLVPCDDLVAHTVDLNYEELKEYYLMPNVDDTEGKIVDMMGKAVQKQLALEAGLPVVNSCVISSKDDGNVIPDSVTYPCFIKPNISRNSSKSKMKKCETREELQETLDERMSEGFELLVEDYLEIKREISFLGLSTPEGVVCPGCFEALVGGEGSHLGVALLGRMMDCNEMEPLITQIREFFKSIKYTGLFDVDLIETVDGKIYVVEFNMRYGGSGYAVTMSGVNLPGMFADYMLKGKPLDMDCAVKPPYKVFTSEKILMDEYRQGLLTKEEADKAMADAEIHFIKEAGDMKPYKHLMKHMNRATKLREETLKQLALEEEEARKEAELGASK